MSGLALYKDKEFLSSLRIPKYLLELPYIDKARDFKDQDIEDWMVKLLVQGYNLRQTCDLLGLPGKKITIFFRDQYQKVSKGQHSNYTEWVLRIRQAMTIGTLVIEHEMRNGDPRRIPALKFLLEKKAPRDYGWKIDIDEDDQTVLSEMTEKEFLQKVIPLFLENKHMIVSIIENDESGVLGTIAKRTVERLGYDDGSQSPPKNVENKELSTAKMAG